MEELIKVLKIKDKILDLEHVFLLRIIDKYNIYDYKEYVLNLEFKLNYLRINGYIDNNTIPEITNKTKELFSKIDGIKQINIKYDFKALHEKLQKELLTLTGKKQKKVDNKWDFLLNSIDLSQRLKDFNKIYKINDWEKIEKLLVLHVQTAVKNNFEKIRLIKYYILGQHNKGSDLYTDYCNFDEIDVKKNQSFDGVNI